MRKPIDTPFLLIVCTIVIYGLLIFTSAALGLLARSGASFSSVAVSQLLLGLVLGSIACALLARLDYRLWRKYTPYFFAAAFILTLCTFVPGIGVELKGASRWIHFGGFSIQPSEILKLAAVAYLAALYAPRMREVGTWRGGILPLALVGGSATLLVILQPDTASAMMIAAGACAILFAAGGHFSHFLVLLLLGAATIGVVAYERPYVAERIETFFDHSQDPQGSGWQIQQSLIAIGSGEFVGKGFGQSIQKFSYLPEPIGDSVFAVVGEEFGFLGTTGLVLLFIAFALLALRIAARAPDPFGGLMVVGITVLIVGQSLFNMASSVGLVPLVGVPLIFVSHGGTALAIALAEVGIILSVSRRAKQK